MNNDNLKIYEKYKNIPNEAKKTITAGRLKGFTDINPMYRIKSLTEEFGPCGIGWYYEIDNKEILDGANGVKIATVDIKMFLKINNEWSKPIYGTGGSTFVAKESNGLYTSDECFKMALTDAISVCCKSLGIGADVYWEKDESKHNSKNSEKSSKKQEDQCIKALEDQIIMIKKLYNENEQKDFLKFIKKEKLEDLTVVEASSLIKRKKEKSNG